MSRINGITQLFSNLSRGQEANNAAQEAPAAQIQPSQERGQRAEQNNQRTTAEGEETSQVQQPFSEQIERDFAKMFGSCDSCQQQLYRQVIQAAALCIPEDADFLFEPQKIFQAFLLAGVNVSSSAAVVADEQSLEGIPPAPSSVSVLDLVTDIKKLKPLIAYCKEVRCGNACVTRFAEVVESSLAMSMSVFCDKTLNPFLKPQRVDGDFGRFDVAAVDTYAQHIKRFNIAKFHEYALLYRVSSYLFDSSVQVLKLMHIGSLSGKVVRALAFTAECNLQQMVNMHDRLLEIQMLTHPNADVREFAKSTLLPVDVPLGLNSDQERVFRYAAEARLKRTRDTVASTSFGGGRRGYNRGRYRTNRGRSRNLVWQNSDTQPTVTPPTGGSSFTFQRLSNAPHQKGQTQNSQAGPSRQNN